MKTLPATAAAPDLSEVGKNALGNVSVHHDASQHHQTSHHNEDKSQHVHHHYHSPPPSTPEPAPVTSAAPTLTAPAHDQRHLLRWAFGLVCIALGTVVVVVMAMKPPGGPAPSTPVSPAMTQTTPPADKAAPASEASVVPAAPPAILKAEVGVYAAGQFTPRTSFTSDELLTLRLRVSRACQVRVLYQPAQGDPMLMFPERDGGSSAVPADLDVLIPDPAKLAARDPGATAFQLYHDTGKGPPIAERVVVQIAEEPFASEGATVIAGVPRRVYSGVSLADVRMRGAALLKGLDAASAQAKMEAAMSERTLSFTIHPKQP